MLQPWNKLSIRLKIIVSVAVSVLLLIVTVYFISSVVLTRSYLEIEHDDMVKDLGRVSDSVISRQEFLITNLQGGAVWDDAYYFAVDHNQKFLDTNYQDGGLAGLDINAIMYTDVLGNLIYVKVIDLETVQSVPSDTVATALLREESLTIHPTPDGSTSGLLMIDEVPFLVASLPLLKSDGTGPSTGNTIFARKLDQGSIADISKITHLSIQIFPYDSEAIPQEAKDARTKFSAEDKHIVLPTSEDTVVGYSFLDDINGKPAIMLRVETPRTVYKQGKETFYTFVTIGTIALVLFGILILLLLESFVLRRFTTLVEGVGKLNDKKDTTLRVNESDSDEIGLLAHQINVLLGWLHEAHTAEASATAKLTNQAAALDKKVEELEALNTFMVDRELKMVELKHTIEALENELLNLKTKQ